MAYLLSSPREESANSTDLRREFNIKFEVFVCPLHRLEDFFYEGFAGFYR
jgi:hypothetical protein